jgi:Leucine-rich repeat (LRR) protein
MSYGNISVMPDSPNYITVIPEEIGELTELKGLNLLCNKVTLLPGSFAKLNNLEFLDLSFNELDIHTEKHKFYGMQKLKYLSIMGNRFDSSDLAELRKHLNPQVRIIATLKDLQSR